MSIICKNYSMTRPIKRRFTLKSTSLADDLDQHALAPAAIEFAVENLLPGAKIKLTGSDGNHDFSSHDGAFQVAVTIIFTGIVMLITV